MLYMGSVDSVFVTCCSKDLLMKPLLHGSKLLQGKWKQHLAIQEYLLLAGPLLFHTSFS